MNTRLGQVVHILALRTKFGGPKPVPLNLVASGKLCSQSLQVLVRRLIFKHGEGNVGTLCFPNWTPLQVVRKQLGTTALSGEESTSSCPSNDPQKRPLWGRGP